MDIPKRIDWNSQLIIDVLWTAHHELGEMSEDTLKQRLVQELQINEKAVGFILWKKKQQMRKHKFKNENLYYHRTPTDSNITQEILEW